MYMSLWYVHTDLEENRGRQFSRATTAYTVFALSFFFSASLFVVIFPITIHVGALSRSAFVYCPAPRVAKLHRLHSK